MRTIDEYMQLPYRMEIIPDAAEGWVRDMFSGAARLH